MRIALVHDDLVQWGGAERVLLAISEVFPEAPIFTSVFDKQSRVLAEKFSGKEVVTSFMQKIPGWRSFYRALLPLYPMAFELFDFSGYDLVISQTTRFAKSVITKPETTHICYCHTPPRFLWNFSSEKVSKFLEPYLSFLRLYDQVSAKRVDFWLAGSKNAQGRIKKVYQASSKVLLPFVDLEEVKDLESFDGGYYLLIARLNKYKRADLAVDTFRKSGRTLKIIGDGPERQQLEASSQQLEARNIEFLGNVSDRVKLVLLAGCKALILTAEEDFGLTPLEAQTLGKPVIAYGKGGALETVMPGRTGVFFDEQSVESLEEALEKFERMKYLPEDCKTNAARFSKKRFQKNLLQLLAKLVE